MGLFCLVLLVNQESNQLFSRPFRMNPFPILPESVGDLRAPSAIVNPIEGEVIRGRGGGCGKGSVALPVPPVSGGR